MCQIVLSEASYGDRYRVEIEGHEAFFAEKDPSTGVVECFANHIEFEEDFFSSACYKHLKEMLCGKFGVEEKAFDFHYCE